VRDLGSAAAVAGRRGAILRAARTEQPVHL
jgi:hypothetical protein